MNTNLSYIRELIIKQLQGDLTLSESAQLEKWMAEDQDNALFIEQLSEPSRLQGKLQLFHDCQGEGAWQRLENQLPGHTADIHHTNNRFDFLRKWGPVAASVLLVLILGVYFWFGHKNTGTAVTVANAEEIQSGKDGAILTLADGSQVILDSLGNGVIALQNGSQAIIKNGELIYDLTGERTGEVVYNTMTTPKGRQFSLLLPDGTRIWLNAASSIRYPTVFAGQERKVELTGEAYFEVAKNMKKPFLVNVNEKVTVEVLGTHFNVNAYENEATINTTLLEGSVRVNGKKIKLGQQAQIENQLAGQQSQQEIQVVNDADLDKVMAWKNGLIFFSGATLDEIMRQLERWYDIEVKYENNKVPNTQLAGKMTRDVPLNGLLKNFEELGVHYKLRGRKLIVLP